MITAAIGPFLAALLAIAFHPSTSASSASPSDIPGILDAIRMVECRDRVNCPDGDGGRSIGPYQISLKYYRDAVEFDPRIGGSYQDCRNRAFAERVVRAYMLRYAPQAWRSGDAEVIARVHNGGPRGASILSTIKYWEKVRRVMGQDSRRDLAAR